MSICIPILYVEDIQKTINWYEQYGFTCTGTHQEPGCGLDWARLELDGAAFMLYPSAEINNRKDAALYFILPSLEGLQSRFSNGVSIIEINERTEFGMQEIVIRDINGFQVTFGCEAGI